MNLNKSLKLVVLGMVIMLIFPVIFDRVFAVDDLLIHAGNKSIKVTTGNPTWGGPYQTIAVEPNKPYVCKLWVKGSGKVILVINSGAWESITSTSIVPNGAWQQFSLSFNPGSNNTILLRLMDSNITGVSYIDDITLGLENNSVNIVKNGGFEGDISFWTTNQNFAIVQKDNPVVADPQGQMIDRYGQFKATDYPGKITTDAELTASVETEREYLNSLAVPTDRDQYGGLIGSKEMYGLQATNYFHVAQISGLNNRWVMVDPLGNIFFSLGVCGLAVDGDTLTKVTGRECIYDWLPPASGQFASAYSGSSNFSFYRANWIKKYGKAFDPNQFAAQQIERIKKWGFNSAGGFSSTANSAMPYLTSLSMPANTMISGVRIYDVFRSNWPTEVETAVKDKLSANAANPLTMGYYIDNELEYDKLKSVIPSAKASVVASKLKLVDMMKTKYISIGAFNTAWGKSYSGFDVVYEATDLSVTTSQAITDFNEFLTVYFDTQYKAVNSAFRKYDATHMLWSDRIATSISKDEALTGIILGAAGRYVDIISYNNYRAVPDVAKIQSMYNAAQKPMVLTEFHYCDTSTGMTPGAINASTAEAKGEAYRSYVEQYAAMGMIVGTHWFEEIDQAPSGRYFQGFNGEGYGLGLIDVTDRPYMPVVTNMKETNDRIYEVILGEQSPYPLTDFEKETAQYTLDGDRIHVTQTIRNNLQVNKPCIFVLGVYDNDNNNKLVGIGVDRDAAHGIIPGGQNLTFSASVKLPGVIRDYSTKIFFWNGLADMLPL